MSKNISKLLDRRGLGDNLFDKVKRIGDGYDDLADHYLVGKSTVFASKSFYDFLGKDHRSKKAWVCHGSSCLCSGDPEAIRTRLEQSLGKGMVGQMTCLGHCYHADSFHYQGRNYSSGLTLPAEDENILDVEQISSTERTAHYDARCQAEVSFLTDNYFSTAEKFKSALQQVFAKPAIESLQTIKASGLRGRGGAGFPTGFKWESCMQVAADKKYIVCNADEGDPGAFSDRYLMEVQPLRVIFGMLVAAWIAGADEGVIYIRAEYPESVAIISSSIDQLKKHNLLGNNILDAGFAFDLKVIVGAGAYICGEETALIASIEGRRAEVDVRPPFPTIEGLFRRPTIVNNVETFAAIQRILGPDGNSFAEMGRGRSTGTKLISLDAGFNRPGIVEIEMGLPLNRLIDEQAEGFRRATKAIHIGGPLGGLVPGTMVEKLTLDFESFDDNGFLLGHGSCVCIPESFPMIRYLEHLFKFTEAESCGKCFPCRLGSTRGVEMISAAISGEKLLNRPLLEDLLITLEQGSLCALGGGLPLAIHNALEYFSEELGIYFNQKVSIPITDVT